MEENKSKFDTEVSVEGEGKEQAEEHPMTAFMDDALSFRRLRPGDIVEGEIVSVSPTEVLVDVGAKSEGLVPSKELERLGRDGLEGLQVGDVVSVYVVRAEDREGNLILSIRRAEEEQDWKRAQELFEASESLETQVAGFNKGGLIVRLGKLRGFVPASQLAARHRGSEKQQPEERWARLVGEPIHVKVIELNRRRKRLILSERAARRQRREVRRAELLDTLRPGEVRTGVVSSLADFGAFVDLGGADGLIHLSELSWNRAAKPDEILRVGQEVEVYVLNVDQERKRIGLSLKRLEPEPWTTVESRYYVGQLVEGVITRLTNFGAFSLVNDEIEGLIHISELSGGRINHPQDVVKEGEKHVMRIIRIDPKRRRMGLSLKRVADPEYADLDWQSELAQAESSLETGAAKPEEDLDYYGEDDYHDKEGAYEKDDYEEDEYEEKDDGEEYEYDEQDDEEEDEHEETNDEEEDEYDEQDDGEEDEHDEQGDEEEDEHDEQDDEEEDEYDEQDDEEEDEYDEQDDEEEDEYDEQDDEEEDEYDEQDDEEEDEHEEKDDEEEDDQDDDDI